MNHYDEFRGGSVGALKAAPLPECPLSEAEQLIREREDYQRRAGALVARLRAEQQALRESVDQRIGEIEAQIRQISPASPGRPASGVECGLVWQRLRDGLAAKPGPVRIDEIAKALKMNITSAYQAVREHPEVFERPEPGMVALKARG